MHRVLPLVLAGILANTAFALPEWQHYDLSLQYCRAAGLPEMFCSRVATESHNTDALEFDDLAAHAQSFPEQNLCEAADATLLRIHSLSSEVARALEKTDASAAAAALGRSLHTIQDNCAHHGMTNPEHAWYTLSDVCQKTSLSPDVAPEALPCAQADTEAAVSAFVEALGSLGVPPDLLASTSQVKKKKAGYTSQCDFLAEAKTWDGQDKVWDRDKMRAPLLHALTAGLLGGPLGDSVCASGPEAIATTPAPTVDTSHGTPSCLKVHLYCLGKADSLEEEPEVTPEAGSGCSMTSRHNAAWGSSLLMLVMLLAALGRPRRQA